MSEAIRLKSMGFFFGTPVSFFLTLILMTQSLKIFFSNHCTLDLCSLSEAIRLTSTVMFFLGTPVSFFLTLILITHSL